MDVDANDYSTTAPPQNDLGLPLTNPPSYPPNSSPPGVQCVNTVQHVHSPVPAGSSCVVNSLPAQSLNTSAPPITTNTMSSMAPTTMGLQSLTTQTPSTYVPTLPGALTTPVMSSPQAAGPTYHTHPQAPQPQEASFTHPQTQQAQQQNPYLYTAPLAQSVLLTGPPI